MRWESTRETGCCHVTVCRGLYKSIFGRIMSVNGKPAFKALSPLYAFQNGHAHLWCACWQIHDNTPSDPRLNALRLVKLSCKTHA